MNITEACYIIGITDIAKENEKSIRKKYKRLMKKCHPDNCGEEEKAKELGEAYSILLNMLIELRKNSKVRDEVKIVQLKDIVKSKKDNIGLSSDKDIVIIDVEILSGGVWVRQTKTNLFNIYCRYSIDLEYPMRREESEIRMRICNNEYSGSMAASLKTVVMEIENFTISVNVYKVIVGE